MLACCCDWRSHRWCWRRCWCWCWCWCRAGGTAPSGTVFEKIIHHFASAPVLRGFVTNGSLWQTHLQHLAILFKIFFVARRVSSSLRLLSNRLWCGRGRGHGHGHGHGRRRRRRRRGDRTASAVIKEIIHDFVTDPFLLCLTSNRTFWKTCLEHLPIPVEIFLIPRRVWHLSWLGFGRGARMSFFS